MASLLLIGGTGFFGKSFLDSFSRGDLNHWGIDKVIAMSRHADQLRGIAPQLLNSRVELVNADIGTVDSLPVADYVIHAAASTDARNYLTKPEAERKNIQSGVYNYCRLAPDFHAGSKIVYVSSGAVYGVQEQDVPFLKEDNLCENIEDMPVHKLDYAIAKRDAEQAFDELCQQHNMQANIARCFAFVGPWLPRDQHFAIGNFIQNGLEGRPIEVKARHPVYRSYMYADDLVNWLMTMAENANNKCEKYNVGSNVAVSILDLAELIAGMFSSELDAPIQTNEKLDRYIPSTDKAKNSLGLICNYDLKSALEETICKLRLQ